MTFILQVLLSFFIGGLFVAGVICITEKLGARVGAAMAGMPLVSLIGLSFIAMTSGPAAAKESALVIVIFSVSTLFYGFVYEKSISLLKTESRDLAASLMATFAWALVNLIIIARIASELTFVSSLIAGGLGVLVFYLLFRNYPSLGVHKHVTTKTANMTRFLIAGFVVGLAVIFAKLLGPMWGGLVASFPVTIAVGLYFLDKSQSDDFTKGFVRELPLAILSLMIFSSMLYLTLLNMNTFISFILSAAVAYLYAFIHVKVRMQTLKKAAKVIVPHKNPRRRDAKAEAMGD
jgi:hypothetical protein